MFFIQPGSMTAGTELNPDADNVNDLNAPQNFVFSPNPPLTEALGLCPGLRLFVSPQDKVLGGSCSVALTTRRW